MWSRPLTTRCCRFVARRAALAGLLLALAGGPVTARQGQLLPLPDTLPGTVIPAPSPPSSLWWSVPIAAAPSGAPLIAGDHVYVTRLPGTIVAHRLSDGTQVWSADLNPEQPLVADKDLVFVVSGEAVHALRAADGRVAWRAPAVGVTAPLLAREGWIVATAGSTLRALRASDGSQVWAADASPQRERAALAGDVLFRPGADGVMEARDLGTGRLLWQRRLGGAPTEPLASGDRVYVGASDRRFYSLDARSGEVAWDMRVGARVAGRATTDGTRVYFIALDNLVRAVDAGHGALRWFTPMPFRPLGEPIVSGDTLLVAGGVAEIRLLRAIDGRQIGTLPLPRNVVVAPAAGTAAGMPVVTVVTGDLAETWRLSAVGVAGISARPPR